MVDTEFHFLRVVNFLISIDRLVNFFRRAAPLTFTSMFCGAIGFCLRGLDSSEESWGGRNILILALMVQRHQIMFCELFQKAFLVAISLLIYTARKSDIHFSLDA